jgi:hypothetical protein
MPLKTRGREDEVSFSGIVSCRFQPCAKKNEASKNGALRMGLGEAGLPG